MEKMKMMQGKFLMLADKMGLNPEIIEGIKKSFDQDEERVDHYEGKTKGEIKEEVKEGMKEWMKEGYHEMPDGEEMKDSSHREIDISKPVEIPMPSKEDILKMDKDSLVTFAMSIINKPDWDSGRANGQEHSPFIAMIKRQRRY